MSLSFELSEKLSRIRADLRSEYLAPEARPWIVGFSGGKDSTLVLHLVFETLLDLPPDARVRPVHVVSNDTLVESPLVAAHLRRVLNEVDAAARAWRLPVKTVLTHPDVSQTFWVNLIGRGYPAPTRMFRWCTDRLKIRPTSAYIRAQVAASGEVILVLGVRRSESSARAKSAMRYVGRLNPHNTLPGCLVYRPILDLTTDEVWEFLGSVAPPWGGSHAALVQLYRDAHGGECPVVVSQDEAPSCGTTSARFGCWTCTVVQKDRSLEGFIEAGFSEFAPLLEFRDWLAQIRNDPERRLPKPGKPGALGPFTLATRREILDRLLALQESVGRQLISAEELFVIKRLWAEALLGTKLAEPGDPSHGRKERGGQRDRP